MYVLDSTYCQSHVRYDFAEKKITAVKIFTTGTDTFTTAFSLYDEAEDDKEYLAIVESESIMPTSSIQIWQSTIPSASFTIVGGVQYISTNAFYVTVAQD